MECETGYKNEKGVECYELLKNQHPAVITPYSTGITLALIPKAAVDHIPVLSMAYGLSASAVGKDFPWIFNPPATYWDGLSIILRYIGGKEGGLDKLKGKTIGYIYFDGGYGLEPIPLLDAIRQRLRLHRQEISGAAGADAEPVEPLASVRRDRPNYMIMWGWGAMNPTAVQEAAKTGYPMDHFIGVWWSGSEDDARPAGAAARVISRSTSMRWAPTFRRSRTSRST